MTFQEWWQENGSLDYDEMAVCSDAWDFHQAKIEALKLALNNLLNDCINFERGELTPIFQEEATKVLQE